MIPKNEQYPGAEIIEWKYLSPSGQPTYYKEQNKPEIIVIHIAQGWASTSKVWAEQGYYGASYHFMVDEDGSIMQHLGFSDGGYHAGISPNAPSPRIPTWKGHGVNVNNYSIGIEHEGMTGEPFEDEQIKASAALCRWLCLKLNISMDRDHIVGHYQIDLVNRPNDPGSTFPWEKYMKLVRLEGSDEMSPEDREVFDYMKVRLTNLEFALFRKTGAEAVAEAKKLEPHGKSLKDRIFGLESNGDKVAREQIKTHVDNHPKGEVFDHEHGGVSRIG